MKKNVNRLASVNKLFADRINLKLPLECSYSIRKNRNNDAFNGNDDDDDDDDEIKLSNTTSTVTSDEDGEDLCQYKNLVP